MGVLKVAFLNAGIIDFFSALAIAVLAVFLGLGHLGLVHFPGFSDLALWQSLFILIIAAEFFTPFRRYAEQYHVKAEGQAAAKELDWYFTDIRRVRAEALCYRRIVRHGGSSFGRSGSDFGAERFREIDLASYARRNRNAVVRFQISASGVGRRMRLDIDGHLCAGGNAGRSDRLESQTP